MEKLTLNSITQYKGTIKFMAFEGGFYGIVTDNNLKLLPVNLDTQYKQNGAVISFTGKLLKNINTIQQWGTAFEVNDIHLIKAGSTTNTSEI